MLSQLPSTPSGPPQRSFAWRYTFSPRGFTTSPVLCHGWPGPQVDAFAGTGPSRNLGAPKMAQTPCAFAAAATDASAAVTVACVRLRISAASYRVSVISGNTTTCAP